MRQEKNFFQLLQKVCINSSFCEILEEIFCVLLVFRILDNNLYLNLIDYYKFLLLVFFYLIKYKTISSSVY